MASTICSSLVRSGCNPAAVASQHAFYPPSPTYLLRRKTRAAQSVTATYIQSSTSASNHEHQLYEWVLDDSLDPIPWPDTVITEVRTDRWRKIPVFVFVYPGALMSLLVSHGNASDAGLMRSSCIDMCINLRVNIVLYDYTGYGSAGAENQVPSERDCYADIEAVFDYCLRQNAWPCASPASIVLYGQSLGSGPSVHLAAKRPCGGLILHSPMTSGLGVLLGHDACLTACLCACDPFPNLSRLPRLRAGAVLIIHGQRDEEIPVTHGQRLYDALPARYRRVNGVETWDSDAASASATGAAKASSPPPSPDAVADPCAPWYPRMAGHDDVQELYRADFYHRMRAFLVSLHAGARGSGDAHINRKVVAEYMAAPLVHPADLHAHYRPSSSSRRKSGSASSSSVSAGGLLSLLSSAVTAPPGPGSAGMAAPDDDVGGQALSGATGADKGSPSIGAAPSSSSGAAASPGATEDKSIGRPARSPSPAAAPPPSKSSPSGRASPSAPPTMPSASSRPNSAASQVIITPSPLQAVANQLGQILKGATLGGGTVAARPSQAPRPGSTAAMIMLPGADTTAPQQLSTSAPSATASFLGGVAPIPSSSPMQPAAPLTVDFHPGSAAAASHQQQQQQQPQRLAFAPHQSASSASQQHRVTRSFDGNAMLQTNSSKQQQSQPNTAARRTLTPLPPHLQAFHPPASVGGGSGGGSHGGSRSGSPAIGIHAAAASAGFGTGPGEPASRRSSAGRQQQQQQPAAFAGSDGDSSSSSIDGDGNAEDRTGGVRPASLSTRDQAYLEASQERRRRRSRSKSVGKPGAGMSGASVWTQPASPPQRPSSTASQPPAYPPAAASTVAASTTVPGQHQLPLHHSKPPPR